MQLTITSDDDFDRVLEAVGAMFGVRLSADRRPVEAVAGGAASPLEAASVEDERVTKTRH